LARAPENFQTVSQLVTESIVLVRKEPALNKGLFFFSNNRCTDFSKNPNFKKKNNNKKNYWQNLHKAKTMNILLAKP
jgi:hypothetical protein